MATNDVYLRPDAGDGANGVRLRPDAPDPSKIDYVLTCNAGAYTYAGSDAILAYVPGAANYMLVCNAGAYTYSGQSAELTVERNVELSAGAYSYAGSDATLTYVPGASAVNYTLECQSGAYVYTGNDAVLNYEPGVVNYDTHDGGDGKKWIQRFKKQKEELRAQLEEAVEAASAVSVPVEVQKVQQAIPVALTKEDIAEVTNEVNLLITQIYMRIAMEKAARQDEDDVETLMLLNG
jgi:hypothetical protein